MHPSGNIITARALDVLPRDVLNRQPRTIAALVGVDTTCDIYGLIDITELEVPKGYVSDVALAGVSLDPSCIG